MKNLLPFILFISFFAAGQELIPVKMLSSAPSGPERYLGSDAFGWHYTTKDNEFRKEKDGQILKFKALSLGEIEKADLQNPLQLVLFYKNFNTVVLLDNQLNETARIQFSELQQPLIAEAVGLASQNRLWVYDMGLQQIGLYSLNQKNFKTLTPPLSEGLRFYQTDYNYFYWIDSLNKCYAVNLFGKVNFLGTVPLFSSAQLLSPNLLLLQQEGKLYVYDLRKESLTNIGLLQKSFKSFYHKGQILSIFTDSEIIQYQITLPE